MTPMTDSSRPERFPVFTLLTSVVLAAANPRIYPADMGELAAWAPLATVVCLMWLGSRLQAWPLGVFATLLVALHRGFDPEAWSTQQLGVAQSCLYVGVLCNLAAARLLRAPSLAWRRWLLFCLVFVAACGYGWRLDRAVGLQLAVGTFAFLGLATLTAVRSSVAQRSNLLAGSGMLIAGPALAAGIAWLTLQPTTLPELLPTGVNLDAGAAWSAGSERLGEAFLVPGWIAGLAVALGWLLAVRRGVRRLRLGLSPASWALAIFGPLALLGPVFWSDAGQPFLVQLPWIVLFLGFALFDLLHASGERLVLKPPEGTSGLMAWQRDGSRS
jgi:hypothetical protein